LGGEIKGRVSLPCSKRGGGLAAGRTAQGTEAWHKKERPSKNILKKWWTSPIPKKEGLEDLTTRERERIRILG